MSVTMEIVLSGSKVFTIDGIQIVASKTLIAEYEKDEFAITYHSEAIGGAASFLYDENEGRRDRAFDEISEEKMIKMKTLLESIIEPIDE